MGADRGGRAGYDGGLGQVMITTASHHEVEKERKIQVLIRAPMTLTYLPRVFKPLELPPIQHTYVLHLSSNNTRIPNLYSPPSIYLSSIHPEHLNHPPTIYTCQKTSPRERPRTRALLSIFARESRGS